MSYLLRIDSSPRGPDSHSRRLADEFEKEVLAKHGIDAVINRDLYEQLLPHIAQDTIAGFYTPPEDMTQALQEATALSDELIAELKGASVVLLSSPIYNFGVPSALKAWIDQVVRIGHTFSYENGEFGGLVPATNAYLALSYGAAGYEEAGPMRAMNFLEPYLTALFGFLGVPNVECFAVQATTGDEATIEAQRAAAHTSIEAHFAG